MRHTSRVAFLSLAGLLGALNAYPALGQEVDLKAATDGLCDYWLDILRDNPNETVEFTGTSKRKPKVKVLVDGDSWRIVLLAGAQKPLFACTILEGDGAIAP